MYFFFWNLFSIGGFLQPVTGISRNRFADFRRSHGSAGAGLSSGGVSGNQDIRALRDMGLYAAIIGKAWYAGAIDLAQAAADAGAQEVEP